MKKTTVNISFDEEKTSALKLYLDQKETSVEAELEKALDVLYAKVVPSGVREFIDLRTRTAPSPIVPRVKKTNQSMQKPQEAKKDAVDQ